MPEWSDSPCPKSVNRLMRDGRIGTLWVYCNKWSCKRCNPKRIESTATELYAACEGFDPIYLIRCAEKDKEAVKKAISRAKLGWFTFTLRARTGALVICSGDASGRRWESEKHPREWIRSGLCDLLEGLGPSVLKGGPAGGLWKIAKDGEEEPKFKTTTAYRTYGLRQDEFKALLKDSGGEIAGDVCLNVDETAAKLGEFENWEPKVEGRLTLKDRSRGRPDGMGNPQKSEMQG